MPHSAAWAGDRCFPSWRIAQSAGWGRYALESFHAVRDSKWTVKGPRISRITRIKVPDTFSAARYRAAAEENTTKIIDNLKIYFVEKKNGESQFRPVEVNQYGAIMDWPEGFFDEGEIESESILQAAMAKRQSRKGE